MKKVFQSLALGTMMILTGCATHLVSPITSTVPMNTETAKVAKAIQAGALDRGWTPKQISPTVIELTLNTREHVVVVDVTYSTKEYAIAYKDSTNMNYDSVRMTIHNKYSKWINNLKRAIDKNLL